VSVFADFNYVALGHLHRPQCIGRKEVRYSGSPLCYSRSEAPCYVVDAQNNFALKKISSDNIEKSVPLVNLDKDGTVSVKLIPLVTSKRMRVIKGSLNNILTAARYESEERRNDYVAADLTDESSVEFSNPIAKLREAYPFSMKPHMINAFKYDADRFTKAVDEENLSAGIAELFKCYFADNNDGEELTDEEFDFVKKIEASLEEVED
jgi:exonuclease SbcD